MPRMACRILLLCTLVLGVSCGSSKDHGHDDKAEGLSRYMLDRLSMKLRHGKLTSDEEADVLQQEDVDTVVRTFMKDDAFVDAVFDFNLYFLGFKNPNIDFPQGKSYELVRSHFGRFSNAISAAIEVASDGDFLTLFDLKQPIYAKPLMHGKGEFGTDFVIDFDEDRRIGKMEIAATLANARRLLRQDPIVTPEVLCDRSTGLRDLSYAFEKLHTQAADGFFGEIGRPPFVVAMNKICWLSNEPLTPSLRDQLLADIPSMESYVTYLLGFDIKHYSPVSVRDFKVLDTKPLALSDEVLQKESGSWFWLSLPNSSTNYNRKRASYILKRLMCDDLTPIAVEQPKEHARGGKHASDPGCMACHYKLDPIGGFFREYGNQGTHYPMAQSPSQKITFDDFAEKDLVEYVSEWKSVDPARSFHVGIIRSTKDDTQNVYASEGRSGPADLFAILRDLPETRQCIVKNAVRYLVDETLSVDAGYIRFLTNRFDKLAAKNSSLALKELFADILKSKSFAQGSVEEGVCYDYAPGVDPSQRPPCQIADVLERNCASCHSGSGAQGGLNLREWIQLSDGYGFQHLDKGRQVSRLDSFARIAAAINSPDEKKRMPLNVFMNPQDRDALYKFFSTMK